MDKGSRSVGAAPGALDHRKSGLPKPNRSSPLARRDPKEREAPMLCASITQDPKPATGGASGEVGEGVKERRRVWLTLKDRALRALATQVAAEGLMC